MVVVFSSFSGTSVVIIRCLCLLALQYLLMGPIQFLCGSPHFSLNEPSIFMWRWINCMTSHICPSVHPSVALMTRKDRHKQHFSEKVVSLLYTTHLSFCVTLATDKQLEKEVPKSIYLTRFLLVPRVLWYVECERSSSSKGFSQGLPSGIQHHALVLSEGLSEASSSGWLQKSYRYDSHKNCAKIFFAAPSSICTNI
jgi:hypothetical protein